MRWSQLLIPTVRENPSDAEVVSHRLMIRAGMIRKLAAGIYDYLPLGLRVLRKVEAIIREEMVRAGAQEVLLPAIQPAELWKESGRWEIYGKELLRLKDRHDREFCFGPTHEEVITDLVRREIRSYKELPVNLFQIQTKFRDEVRPRFGLMRGREFIMKDAYSFDVDDDAAKLAYQKMFDAYTRIFRRCGLTFRPVEADTGAIGGRDSHEFHVLADSGEDLIVSCTSCDYAANVERARVAPLPPVPPAAGEAPAARSEVATPDARTVDEVCAALAITPADLAKTLIVVADGEPVAAVVRGDHELNEPALRTLLGAGVVELAGPEVVREVTGAAVGFAGPVGLSIPVVVDEALRGHTHLAVGANRDGFHRVGIAPERDFEVRHWGAIRRATESDRCAVCGGALDFRRGIEVGHVFRLGTKYSEALGCTFLDADGRPRPMVMGCYGIGVGRTAAAAIEQNHDERGIRWPVPLAPFEVAVLALNPTAAVLEAAGALYSQLLAAGIDAIFDDRPERAGVKFNDAELVGFPLVLVVGAKGLESGEVELKDRRAGTVAKVPLATAAERVREQIVRDRGA
ncbi:MAG: proline--tRNA ligase [bacterium]